MDASLPERCRDPEALTRLRDKYATLVELRRARAGEPGGELPRTRLRALAREFPSALRELELRTDADLAARLQGLTDALAGGPIPAWAPLQIAYHGMLRSALGLKAALVGVEQDAALFARRHLEAASPCIDAPPPGFWNGTRLAQVARPRGGRLSVLTIRWVAEEFGVSASEVRAAVLPGGH